MGKYIDTATLKEIEGLVSGPSTRKEFAQGFRRGVFSALGVLKAVPATDVAPVIHAKWGKARDCVCCSSCGFKMFPLDAYQKGEWPNMCVTFCDAQKYIPRFCPDCGAKMDA